MIMMKSLVIYGARVRSCHQTGPNHWLLSIRNALNAEATEFNKVGVYDLAGVLASVRSE